MKPQLPPDPEVSGSTRPCLGRSQAGGSILGVVAILGVSFALVQGTLFYRAKSSARFQAAERNKVLALQVAEAGVEENIADLGSRRIRPTAGMVDHVTYAGHAVGSGTFTSTLTTVATGPEADTLDLVANGRVASSSQAVQARLKLRRVMDTTRTPIMTVTPEVTVERFMVTRPETTLTTVVQDPATMPAINRTPAYQACMSSSDRTCGVCHIPQGNPANRHVIYISKNAINTHINHHGCYVTTDGTCDLYNPREVPTVSMVTRPDSIVTVRDRTTYETVVVIDTMVKVQVLSWK